MGTLGQWYDTPSVRRCPVRYTLTRPVVGVDFGVGCRHSSRSVYSLTPSLLRTGSETRRGRLVLPHLVLLGRGDSEWL